MFWMNNEKFTTAGFEPATSGLKCRRSIGGLPILSMSLFGGGGGGGGAPGASQKS